MISDESCHSHALRTPLFACRMRLEGRRAVYRVISCCRSKSRANLKRLSICITLHVTPRALNLVFNTREGETLWTWRRFFLEGKSHFQQTWSRPREMPRTPPKISSNSSGQLERDPGSSRSLSRFFFSSKGHGASASTYPSRMRFSSSAHPAARRAGCCSAWWVTSNIIACLDVSRVCE